MYRKALWALAALIAVALVTAVTLPFLIDLSHLKPQVQAQLSRYLDARLDYESARLNLLGGPELRLDGVRLIQSAAPFAGQEAMRAEHVAVELQLWPLFRGELVGRLVVERPVITVRLVPAGSNLAALVHGGKEPAPEGKAPPDTASGELGFLERLSIEALDVRDATVQAWRGSASAPFLDLSDLTAHVDEFAVNRPFLAKLMLRCAYSSGSTRVDGPIVAHLQPTIRVERGRFERVAFGGDIRLDDVAIDAGGKFVKPAGKPLALRFEGDATAAGASVKPIELVLEDLKGQASLNVLDWTSLTVALGVHVQTDEMSRLAMLFPMYHTSLLKGPMQAALRLDGPLTVSDRLSGSLQAKAALAGSDLALDVAVASFAGPKASIQLRGRELRLDELLAGAAAKSAARDEPEPTSSATATAARPAARGIDGAGELDELFAGIRRALPDAEVDLSVKLGALRFSGFVLDDVALTAALERLVATVESLRFGAFDGRLATRLTTNLRRPGAPRLSGKVELEGAQLAHVLDALLGGLPNVVSGHVDADTTFSTVVGALPVALAALDAKGSFRFADGAFQPLNVGAAFAKQVNALFATLPIPGKRPRVDLEDLGRLDDFGGSFRIERGKARISGAKSTDQGRLELAGTVSTTKGLDARLTWTASDAVRQQILATWKQASYLFDARGELTIDAKLTGPVTKPQVTVDTAPLLARVKRRLAGDMLNELEKRLLQQLH